MAAKRALITGIHGQDGTYLAQFLRDRGYEVFGEGVDVRDQTALVGILQSVSPDECYHLAAQHRSSAATTELDDERRILEVNLLSTQTILHTLRRIKPEAKVFLAGSCHIFGETIETPQNELTPIAPNSVYGITKAGSMQLGALYRRTHGMFVCTGILYQHESPLRRPGFLSRNIVSALAEIVEGKRTEFLVGSLQAQVDWGFAGDYVEAMWLMLQQILPNDYIVASGALHTVQDFISKAYAHAGLDWQRFVREDASVYRPVSGAVYQGNIERLRDIGWSPKTSFDDLVKQMVDAVLNKKTGP
jgi:GDPmannose 4,6-dehydratase